MACNACKQWEEAYLEMRDAFNGMSAAFDSMRDTNTKNEALVRSLIDACKKSQEPQQSQAHKLQETPQEISGVLGDNSNQLPS